MIGDPQEGAFLVWSESEEASEGRMFGPAGSAPRAAELRAREDWLAGETHWPRTYRTRCDATGTISSVEVTIAMQPSFVTIASHEVPMDPATHVLWGGTVLCEDDEHLWQCLADHVAIQGKALAEARGEQPRVVN